jgi:osmotically-inducible protein OsmY
MQNMKNIIAIGSLSAAIAIASLAGCSTTMSTSSKPHDERSDGRVVDDDHITKSVEEKLKAEPVYKFGGVGVKTYSGIVQLSGFVNSADQSRRAEDIARGVGGVTQVANGLVVKPAPIPTATGRPSGQNPGSNTNTSQPQTTGEHPDRSGQ